MNVLIVDDQEENRYLLEALLTGNGHDVTAACNGEEALEKLKSGGADLIISDILMPVMDGFELCRKVRMDETLRQIPFIIYTATYTGPQDEAFALKIGADRFIVKPCEPDVFMDAVRDVTAAADRSVVSPPAQAQPREEEVLKLYNERLVRKLEQKMLQLENEVRTRQKAEEILRQSEEKYKTILRSIEDGYYEVDLKGNFVFFNRSMCRIIDYSASEMTGMNSQDYMDQENARKVFQTFNHVYSTGEPYRALDWELIKKDGTKCHVDTSVSLIRDPDGKPIGFRGIARDVTERKIAEKEKARLTEQLQQAQRMESIGRLAGGVAHDFNNLLSIILGYGEIILEDLDREHPHREPLEQIYQAGIRARALTRQLLAFGRKQVLETRIMDLNNVVTGFEKLLRRLIGEHIQLELTLTAEPLPVRADITQLEQVLMNLAVNARDAMGNGGTLIIETAFADSDLIHEDAPPEVASGGYAMIGFSDTGHGMDQETLSRIFEPFFTTKDKEKGTGLGLATSYGIIKQHGGTIWVYSEPGQGSIFKIYLPISEETDVLRKPASPMPESLNGTETILLVEDNEMVRDLARIILQNQGYKVLAAENGDAALSLLDRHAGAIHLLLTDVVMPGMSGKDMIKQISGRFPHIRVLYMSGYTNDVIAHRGLLDAGVFFIQKPLSVKALAAKVREVLDA
jgi:PAS domain S-box-containing protein